MASVTDRVKEVKQPRGGYIKPSEFEVVDMNDGITLYEEENVHASVIGMAVDYLTRFNTGTDLMDAFKISLMGVMCAKKMGIKNADKVASVLLANIKGLDDKSIDSACKLVTFDVWYRNPMAAMLAKPFTEINPDKATIENIRTLVNRSTTFFEKYGPVIQDGFTFAPVKEDVKAYEKMIKTGKGIYGGYTPTVSSGDGDFLTADTLWDFKVSKSKPTNKHTLQLLMYWIMGQHSGQDIYKNITKLGIFNPRLNEVYLLDMNNVPELLIKEIESTVICY